METKNKMEIEIKMETKIRRLSSQSIFGIRKRPTMKPGLRLKLKHQYQVGIATWFIIIIVILTARSCMLVFFSSTHVCIRTAGPRLAAWGLAVVQ